MSYLWLFIANVALVMRRCSLGVKQPAISNTLAELRRFFDDELFVRRGRQLQATSRAEAILKALEPALELLSELTMPYMKDTRKCSL
ncbi:leucine transcriptional activator [Pseudomonas putida S11]|nr:leucine transcriptional activator [Pseudomonas putida S11]